MILGILPRETELPLPPIVFGLLLILLAITVGVGKGRPHS